MEKQKLILIRDFLFRVFFVGLFFAILLFVMTTVFWDKWSSFIYVKFHLPEEKLAKLFINSLLFLRLYLVFGILTPAIAMHWLIKSKKG